MAVITLLYLIVCSCGQHIDRDNAILPTTLTPRLFSSTRNIYPTIRNNYPITQNNYPIYRMYSPIYSPLAGVNVPSNVLMKAPPPLASRTGEIYFRPDSSTSQRSSSTNRNARPNDLTRTPTPQFPNTGDIYFPPDSSTSQHSSSTNRNAPPIDLTRTPIPQFSNTGNTYFPPDSTELSSPKLVGISSGSTAPPTPIFNENSSQEWEDHVNDIIVNGLLKFTLDMETNIYRTQSMTITGQEDNIVFSPISLAVTMAIVLAGSAGRTFDEVSKLLGLESGVDISQKSEIVHQMFGELLTQLRTKIEGSPGPRVDFATASYVQDGYPIRSQFKTLSENVYNNEVINVDFARNGQAAQNAINEWVKEKTMGKISSILNNVPGPETSVILLSALYFKGEWNQHFMERTTRRKQFFVKPNKPIEVDMMYNGGDFPFYEDKQLGVKILGLPYKGHQISMYILLPTANSERALRDLKNQLTVDTIEKLINSMKNETCIIGLPKMKLSSSLELRSTLAALGLKSLFDPAMADLSLISPGYGASMETQPPNNNVRINPRFNGQNGQRTMVKRNYFAYDDKVRGLTVKQWDNGFNITRIRNRRHSGGLPLESSNSYSVEGSESNNNAKIVNLESNKYRFEKETIKNRSNRDVRPIDKDFLKFLKQKNLRSFGLDELRNSANLVNPHLYASNVLHKVAIDITEKGTEAAATTSVILDRDGSQKMLIANKPFIFFIRHDPTKLVLFWGTLNTPTPNFSNNKPEERLIFN